MAHEPLNVIYAKSILYLKTVQFQTIQFSKQKQFYFKQSSLELKSSSISNNSV